MREFHKKTFQKQAVMRKVIMSLIPVIVGSIYFFGWRTLILMATIITFGVATEYLFEKRVNKKVTEAVFVSCILFTLTLPVSTPLWVGAIGIIFGITFSKEVFGGFGFNVFNPALAARTFVYVTFPEPLTISWNVASSGFLGGFTRYITPAVDTLSQASPLIHLRDTGTMLPFQQLFFGNSSGSLGETSGLLILVGALILLKYKSADWILMAGPIIGFLSLSSILYTSNVSGVQHPLFALFSGGFLFMSIFMTTDPITAPKTKEGKWIYGLLIGVITVIIRVFGLFVEGAMFSVLIMNIFVPILDDAVKYIKTPNKKEASA